MPFASEGQGRLRITLENQSSEQVHLTVGKSMIINTQRPVKRVSLAAPAIADPLIISSRQLYLMGKTPGITSLTLWDSNDRVMGIVDLEVAPDLSRIQNKLREILPDENIRVTATHDAITLFGDVSSTTDLALAEKLAEAYAPQKVINLLQVSGVHEAPMALSPFLLEQLKAKLREILPDEDIRVTATHDAISLFGEVSSATNLSRALDIAEAYAPKKVLNLLQVSGVHQVMLEVRVAEMSRSLARRLGINFAAVAGGNAFGVSMLNNLTAVASPVTGIPGAGGLGTAFSQAINALVGFQKGNMTWTFFIDALKEEGLVTILAEPTLVTLSGQEANFLAGGEFPIPVPQGLDTITIEFKTFGVGLTFTPTVLSEDKISMKVAPEVSDLDFSNALNVSGFVVPALTVRRASTVVELASGQSFAIAGLLNETVREIVSKFPVLGDIPILGALFRSSSFQKNETELIIIVTPHLVRPQNMAQQPLPTDPYIEPNDFEFYLQGRLEGEAKGRVDIRRLDGEFGYLYGPLQEAP